MGTSNVFWEGINLAQTKSNHMWASYFKPQRWMRPLERAHCGWPCAIMWATHWNCSALLAIFMKNMGCDGISSTQYNEFITSGVTGTSSPCTHTEVRHGHVA
ncbi:hypothetical protein HAX54_015564 [Datura stramonium]|uniref:Uncharacterized protein n=1 Tax=Datura stramonium TaxID=4076 RepID=A0ABS8TSD0_DATST|nr:hypothetical protein [Datura stramonium]